MSINNTREKKGKIDCIFIVVIFLLFVFCSGCGKNPLTFLSTKISFGGEADTSTKTNLSPNNSKRIKYIYVPVKGPDEIIVTIEKIEITETGEKWIEIFNGNQSVRMVYGGAQATFDLPVSVPYGEYHGVKIWFGSIIKAKRYGGKYGAERYYEKDGFNKNNPFIFDTINGLLPYPVTIESGKETRLVMRFPVAEVAAVIVATQVPLDPGLPASERDFHEKTWIEYRDIYIKEMIIIGATRIKY